MQQILDSQGKPLVRRLGFIGGYEHEKPAKPTGQLVSLVGFQVPITEEDEEEK